jgi:two-component system cell cycle response regulator
VNLSPTARLALRAAQALSLGGVAAYALQAGTSFCGAGADNFFETYVYNALIFAAAGFCLVRAYAVRVERGAWLVLGLGLFSWALGEAYFSIFYAQQLEPPLPNVSDGFWLAFYPACYIALVLLVRRRVREFRQSLWLDGVVGALAAAAIGADLVFGAIVGGGRDTATVAIDLSYALGDLLLLGFVVAVFAMTGWRPGRALVMVGAGLATGAVVDSYFLYETAIGSVPSTTLVASLWPASALLLGSAAWLKPTETQPVRFEGWRVLVMPSLFALTGLALLVYQTFSPQNALALALAAATLAAVIVRMAVTFRENIRLLQGSRHEALTDALTGLGNRRCLLQDLQMAVETATPTSPWGLMLLDLDGFKQYNDRFGHPTGDALLARLGLQLAIAVRGYGTAYRLGGDEFCVVASGSAEKLQEMSETARIGLSESGEGFDITSSCGFALIPHDADEVTLALHVADERLYAQKEGSRRSSVGSQTGAALLQALEEREPDLRGHLDQVADLTRALGRNLGLSLEDVEDATRAAQLHDVGKVAIPDSILEKPESLDEAEWAFVRSHTIVGARILGAAPALTTVAKIVRASHEHFDGEGYPDRLAGEEIPLGARIVSVCDAYHSMRSKRPYGRPMSQEEALEELRRCAGQQFDPAVVAAFCGLIASGPLEAALADSASNDNGADHVNPAAVLTGADT